MNTTTCHIIANTIVLMPQVRSAVEDLGCSKPSILVPLVWPRNEDKRIETGYLASNYAERAEEKAGTLSPNHAVLLYADNHSQQESVNTLQMADAIRLFEKALRARGLAYSVLGMMLSKDGQVVRYPARNYVMHHIRNAGGICLSLACLEALTGLSLDVVRKAVGILIDQKVLEQEGDNYRLPQQRVAAF